ncbi:ankyrin repeat domain-containing protein [Rickettsiales endosymbiont of Stachyamoeba lipophora]|uniref:ankyrin repeat domain-containing protein n=1 Tax=Rickettsiales endosymbiont of Stachyamoeba lipophora TaxID=2486578 RepID=UPI000F649FBA|nr:ankyrin repeat domain-containing protein [Rickettsiales endosymbiont of Stachyamoeba lipophora]AZL14961.1 ankyrin repeat domain-containing protein [Rickettsiales endosymbiont of Stachyamoeba lipophora]
MTLFNKITAIYNDNVPYYLQTSSHLYQQLQQLDEYGYTVIHQAIADNDLTMLKFWLKLAKSYPECSNLINLCGEHGSTPTHMACHLNYPEGIKILIENGASLTEPNQNGHIALHIAAQFNAEACARIILEQSYGLAFNTDKDGSTPLHTAAVCSAPETALAILQTSPTTMNIQDGFGFTPAHYAAYVGATKVLTILKQFGADFNLTNNEGNTPLHLNLIKMHQLKSMTSLTNNQPEIINIYQDEMPKLVATTKFLLDNGAKTTIYNYSHVTALNIVIDNQFNEIADYLMLNSQKDSTHDNKDCYAKDEIITYNNQADQLLTISDDSNVNNMPETSNIHTDYILN